MKAKRSVALILAFVMLLSLLPTAVLAVDPTNGLKEGADKIKYELVYMVEDSSVTAGYGKIPFKEAPKPESLTNEQILYIGIKVTGVKNLAQMEKAGIYSMSAGVAFNPTYLEFEPDAATKNNAQISRLYGNRYDVGAYLAENPENGYTFDTATQKTFAGGDFKQKPNTVSQPKFYDYGGKDIPAALTSMAYVNVLYNGTFDIGTPCECTGGSGDSFYLAVMKFKAQGLDTQPEAGTPLFAFANDGNMSLTLGDGNSAEIDAEGTIGDAFTTMGTDEDGDFLKISTYSTREVNFFPNKYTFTFTNGDNTNANALTVSDSTSGAVAQANGTVEWTVSDDMAITSVPINEPTDPSTTNKQFFSGWESEDGTVVYTIENDTWSVNGTPEPDGYVPTSDVTFNAQWTPALVVTFDPNTNGGTGVTYEDGKSTYVVNVNPAVGVVTAEQMPVNSKFTGYDGHAITGWTLNDGTTTEDFVAGTTPITQPTTTLEAKWVEGYTVAYHKNVPTGVTVNGVPADPDVVIEASAIANYSIAAAPTRADYTFAGWNTAANGTGTAYAAGATVDLAVTKSLDLYAQWTAAGDEQATVTFDGNGATHGFDPGSVTVNKGDTILRAQFPADADLLREGYEFTGWYTDANATDKIPDGDYTAADNVTLYAGWTADTTDPNAIVTVTFTSPTEHPIDGGNPADITVAKGQKVAAPEVPVVTSGNAVFGGWKITTAGDEQNKTYEVGYTVPDNATDFTVEAQWFTDINIKFDLNGGQGTVIGPFTAQSPTLKVNELTGWSTMADPTFDGYDFKGWGTASNGATPSTVIQKGVNDDVQLKDLASEVGKQDVTLYAQWEVTQATIDDNEDRTVIFDKNGGAGEANPASVTVKVDNDPGTEIFGENRMPNNPTRAGYECVAWNFEPNGSGDAFTENTVISDDVLGTDETDKSVTVYAQWKYTGPDAVTVNFVCQDGGNNVGTVKLTQYVVKPGTVVDATLMPDTQDAKDEATGKIFKSWHVENTTTPYEVGYVIPANSETPGEPYTLTINADLATIAFFHYTDATDGNKGGGYATYDGTAKTPGLKVTSDAAGKTPLNEITGADYTVQYAPNADNFDHDTATWDNQAPTNAGEYQLNIVMKNDAYVPVLKFANPFTIEGQPVEIEMTDTTVRCKDFDSMETGKSLEAMLNAAVNLKALPEGQTAPIAEDAWSYTFQKKTGTEEGGTTPTYGPVMTLAEMIQAQDAAAATDPKSVFGEYKLIVTPKDTNYAADPSQFAIEIKGSDAKLAEAVIKVKYPDKPSENLTLTGPDYETAKPFDPEKNESPYYGRSPVDASSVDLSGIVPSDPNNKVVIVIDGKKVYDSSDDSFVDPANPETSPKWNDPANLTAVVLPPAENGEPSEIKVTVTTPDYNETTNNTPDTKQEYVFNIQQVGDGKIVLSYGNSPYGLIMRDSNIADDKKDAAKAAFVAANNRFTTANQREGLVPEDAYLNRNYRPIAWGEEIDVNDPEQNVDRNDYAIFIYNRATFRDPGFTATDGLGNPVAETEITRTITVNRMGGSGANRINDANQTPDSITVTGKEAKYEFTELTGLTGTMIRPDIYTMTYSFTDPVSGKTVEETRKVIVLMGMGDTNIDAQITSPDLNAIKNHTSGGAKMATRTTGTAQTVYLYRIADTNGDGQITSPDLNAVKNHTSGGAKIREMYNALT